ncbi:protein S100-A6 [Acipenser ruthenus]|uniref:protein S100-A6-like n=1 Tax=Acipenser ruthenus TaxID=7906 RepID=UPI00145BB33B|nr:protein S100-A6-like [Acipenser ruthenus]XP_058875631.1 protein S100-A6 [Acipenser ruthenus]
MSQLESAVQSLVDVFIKYAEQEGSKNQLSQGELKKLITTELSSGALGKKVGPEEVGELMGQLDKNHDGEVNMQEFCRFIGILAKGYYKSKKKGSP